MKTRSIISRDESLQILANDLRQAALKECANELKDASAEKRNEILAEIERDVKRELRRRNSMSYPDALLF